MATAETHTEPEQTTYLWSKRSMIHPDYINHHLHTGIHDMEPDFVREALQTFLVQLTTKGIDFQTARSLVNRTHRIEIDDESDETNYLITIVAND
jgi:hypothetical protein